VPPSERLIDDLADAILDCSPIDWAAAESSSDATEQLLVKQLRVLAAVADLHRSTPPPSPSTLFQIPASCVKPKVADAPVMWSHLRLFEGIGRGAFGEVYRAWDTRLDREVALKLLPAGPSSGDRAPSAIIHEGRLLARVRHPNVVTIYGAEQISDQIGLWMEFVRGHTLEQILDKRKVVSTAEAVGIGLELCRAMSAVHGAGLLHRDIKTHNVMRAEDGRIVLMDFGTGREIQNDASSDLAGTPLYLAPEVLEGQQATVRSDIYSLGVLLYHLISGSYPVHARTVREVRRAHERGERTAVRTARRDVPPKLARVIERAIDPRPERRYESADALGADLAALKLRPRIVRLAYAAGVAAAFMVVGVGWEVAGRRVGSSGTPSALLAGFAGLNSVGAVNISPAERPIIAVLPLMNLSVEPDGDYFVDGLTDEIIRNLAVIKGLEVRSRTSSFAFKDKTRNLRDVGEQLGVNLIVEGSIMRSGSRLRINAQLVQVAGDVPLWAERFDRDLADVFSIQDEISRAIVNKLRLTLGRGQRRYDTSVGVYELYLKARTVVERRGVLAPREAVGLFEQVIAKDAAFAPAYAGLADAYAFMSMSPYRLPDGRQGVSADEAHSIMRPAAVKALQLDPLLAEAHAAMGLVYSRERDWDNAQKSFRRAIDLNPSLSQIYTNYSLSTLRPLEKLDEADRVLQVAQRIDPLSLEVPREIAQVQIQAGRFEEAIANLERVRAVDPAFPYANLYLGRALMFAGRLSEAIPLLEKEGAGAQQFLAHAFIRTGRRAEAERLATAHRGYPFREAIIYAGLGDKDRAFEALERMAVAEPNRVPPLLTLPEMAGLRGDTRFAALRQRLGLP
jgi:TolB-like protein/tRNA A-37 threonylcarbamoyl transferase component Bud32